MTDSFAGNVTAPVAPTLVVLAAGVGSRFGGLKQMEPVGPDGEAVLDYSVFDARRAGFGKVVFVIRRDIEEVFREVLGRRLEGQVEVSYAFQALDFLPAGYAVPTGRAKPWGTGQAVLSVAAQVKGPFAVINADDFYGMDSYRVLADFLRTPPALAPSEHYAMVGFQLDRTLSDHGYVARGVSTTNAGGFLTSVEELTHIERGPEGLRNVAPDGTIRSLSGKETVSMNFWGFMPSIFGQLEPLFRRFLDTSAGLPKSEFYIPVAVNELVCAGQARVKVLPTTSSWFGVTYREDRAVVVESIRALIRSGAYPEHLWR
jgi:hypothetical protein